MPRPFDEALFDEELFDVALEIPPSARDDFTVVENGVSVALQQIAEILTTGQAGSTPIRASGPVVVQIYGDAVAFTGRVERSTRDPAVGANWAPVGLPLSGNPYEGIQPTRYEEPSRAWWRLRIDSMNEDGVVTVTFSTLKV